MVPILEETRKSIQEKVGVTSSRTLAISLNPLPPINIFVAGGFKARNRSNHLRHSTTGGERYSSFGQLYQILISQVEERMTRTTYRNFLASEMYLAYIQAQQVAIQLLLSSCHDPD